MGISVTDGPTFSLSNSHVSYIFRVDPSTKELLHVHFGECVAPPPPAIDVQRIRGWSSQLTRLPREFPDHGRGDFRQPAVRIQHDGHTVTHFQYAGYEITKGKPGLDGLPSTFASDDQADTLVIHLTDDNAEIDAYLSYSIFHEHAVITRSQRFVNRGSRPFVIEQASSFSVDLPNRPWDMLQLCGEWSRETQSVRRPVYPGSQGFQSNSGYSGHLYNPFVGLLAPETTETAGDAFGFSLIYSGSFQAHVEKPYNGLTRVLLGINPSSLVWSVEPGNSFNTPECVAIFSPNGLGGMSRSFHRLYRQHLSRSKWTAMTRPALLNNWEGTYFDFDDKRLYNMASSAAGLGCKLFVLDDGWFGDKHARRSVHSGLGDWLPNPKLFPDTLSDLVKRVNDLGDGCMRFGIWVEPEMVNPASELYEAHPDWVLHAGQYTRTTQRNQLVLNLSLEAVQDYIIKSVSALLSSANITYVKWDNNRGMHELPSPATGHAYMLGLYRVLDVLTLRFPDVLFEGCASGGGRIDPGILHYWPQSWTSDNTDGLDRLSIQFGASLVYPASSMGGHISAVPNHQTHRVTPLTFRAHVAMMCGSFGLELDPLELSSEEPQEIPRLIALSERINPLVVRGDQYRLAGPETNWPAVQYVSVDGNEAIVLAFQIKHAQHVVVPTLKPQGLDGESRYEIVYGGEEKNVLVDGNTLQRHGLSLGWRGDLQSRVVWITRHKKGS